MSISASQTPVFTLVVDNASIVTGAVVDKATKAPVANAEVKLTANDADVIYAATTDAEGKFNVSVIQANHNFTVSVAAEDYTTAENAATVSANFASPLDLGTIEIEKADADEATEATITIDAAIGYASFYDSKHAVKVPAGVTAYVFTENDNNELGLVEYAEALSWDGLGYDGVIPAGKAVVLKGAGEVVLEYATTELTAEDGANYLLGTDEDQLITENLGGVPCRYYALTLNAENDPESVGFYWMNETGAPFVNKAHKAYLVLPLVNPDATPLNAKKAYLFKGDATAIKNANAAANSEVAPMFNVAGQRVNKDVKGIVIKNGKKMLVK